MEFWGFSCFDFGVLFVWVWFIVVVVLVWFGFFGWFGSCIWFLWGFVFWFCLGLL